VLVNCIPAKQTLRFVSAIADLGVRFGAYANAGHTDDGLGWHPDPDGPQRYADLAQGWVELGATLIGSCCGTGPAHIQELHTRFCGQSA
jgi:S-methylmethionine-dependent homocysteine/selenocysteine methylase